MRFIEDRNKQCSVCGHHQHSGSCGVGTDKSYPVDTPRGIQQRMCECDGIHKETVIESMI
jgi:hypothetical protein